MTWVSAPSYTYGPSEVAIASGADGEIQYPRPVILLIEGGTAPIQTTISYEDGLWLIEDRATGIFGSGATLDEATVDFRHALEGHLGVLLAAPALSAGLQEQLGHLRRYLPHAD
jgi:hypothetical protein